MFFCAASMTASRSQVRQRLGGLGGLLLQAVADPLAEFREPFLQATGQDPLLGLQPLGHGRLRGDLTLRHLREASLQLRHHLRQRRHDQFRTRSTQHQNHGQDEQRRRHSQTAEEGGI